MLSDLEKGVLSVEPEKTMPVPVKPSQSPQHGVLALKSGQEVSTPSIIREKVAQDGYNWRKYGQKLVKENEYVRSYYRCTHPNCQVKKQLKCSHGGQIVDIVYFGHHDHPKPQLNNNNPLTVGFVMSTDEERHKEPSLTTAEVVEHSLTFTKSEHADGPPGTDIVATDSPEGTISQSNKTKEVKTDNNPASKRQKKDERDHKTAIVGKSTSEPRLVVETRSEVDVVNDGHRWRKYGQKIVKGSPYPRSYYRCSNSGCPVKKHVERASHYPKVVVTTYEGEHNHDMPPTRIVTHNVPGSNASPKTYDGDLGTKSDALAILENKSKSKEQLNSESGTKSAVNETVGSNIESCLNLDSKSDKRKNGLAITTSERQKPDSEPV